MENSENIDYEQLNHKINQINDFYDLLFTSREDSKSIKDQLNVNPSKQIDDFLNLKSPNEELTVIVTELLNPKNLEKLATQFKPILDKNK